MTTVRLCDSCAEGKRLLHKGHCSTAASSAVDDRHTHYPTAAIHAADGRRTTNLTGKQQIHHDVMYGGKGSKAKLFEVNISTLSCRDGG